MEFNPTTNFESRTSMYPCYVDSSPKVKIDNNYKFDALNDKQFINSINYSPDINRNNICYKNLNNDFYSVKQYKNKDINPFCSKNHDLFKIDKYGQKKVTADKMIPSDRIYEIRKEKILIKAADRNENCPLKSKSQHTDLYNKDIQLNLNKNLKSNSIYKILSDNNEKFQQETNSNKKNDEENNKIYLNNINDRKEDLILNQKINNDTIYVAMTKDEYLEREANKFKG